MKMKRKNEKKMMKLTQQKVDLLQKLDLRGGFVSAMINFYARSKLGPCDTDPEVFKKEALRYARMYGDCFIHHYYRYTNY